MSDNQAADAQKNNLPNAGRPSESPDNTGLTPSKTMQIYRPRPLLSPWVQRSLQPRSTPGDHTKSQERTIVGERPVSLVGTNASFLINSEQQIINRSRVWVPDLGSLEPALADHFASRLVERSTQFKPIAVKSHPEPSQTWTSQIQDSELLLPGESGDTPAASSQQTSPSPQQEQQEMKRPSVPRLPQNQPSIFDLPQPEPAQTSQRPARPIRPVVPPNFRPVARVEEVSPNQEKPPIPKPPDPSPAAETPAEAPEDLTPRIRTRPRPPRPVMLSQSYQESKPQTEPSKDETRDETPPVRTQATSPVEPASDWPDAAEENQADILFQTSAAAQPDAELPLRPPAPQPPSLPQPDQAQPSQAKKPAKPVVPQSERPARSAPVQQDKSPEETKPESFDSESGKQVRAAVKPEEPTVSSEGQQAIDIELPLRELSQPPEQSAPAAEAKLKDADRAHPTVQPSQPPDDAAKPSTLQPMVAKQPQKRQSRQPKEPDSLAGDIEPARPVIKPDEPATTSERQQAVETELPMRELSPQPEEPPASTVSTEKAGDIEPIRPKIQPLQSPDESAKPLAPQQAVERQRLEHRSEQSSEAQLSPAPAEEHPASVAGSDIARSERDLPLAKPAQPARLSAEEQTLEDEQSVRQPQPPEAAVEDVVESVRPLVKPDEPAEPSQLHQALEDDLPVRPAPQQPQQPAPTTETELEDTGLVHPEVKPAQPAKPSTAQPVSENELPIRQPKLSAEPLTATDDVAEDVERARPLVKPDPFEQQQAVETDLDAGLPVREQPQQPVQPVSVKEEEKPLRPVVKPDKAANQPAEPRTPQQAREGEQPVRQSHQSPEKGMAATGDGEPVRPVVKPDEPATASERQQARQAELPIRKLSQQSEQPTAPVEKKQENEENELADREVKPGETAKPSLERRTLEIEQPPHRLQSPEKLAASVGGATVEGKEDSDGSLEESEPVRPVVKPDESVEPSAVQRAIKAELPISVQPAQAGPPIRTFDQDVLARAASRQQMPLIDPRLLSRIQAEPEKPAIPKKPAAPQAALTPQLARSYLEARGWRFKRASRDSSGDPRLIARTVTDLERGSTPARRLENEPRTAMEAMIQRDLGDVRIHQSTLAPLNVQAATKGSDIYFDSDQNDSFETPESMALLGHELTHVAQQSKPVQPKPAVVQLAPLPLVQRKVEADEAEADTVERTILRRMGNSSPSSTTGPAISRSRRPALQRAELTDMADVSDMDLPVAQDTGSGGEAETAVFETLQAAVEAIIEDRVQMLLGSLGLETNEDQNEAGAAETKNGADLDDLAKKVFPYLKRRIAIERERKIGW